MDVVRQSAKIGNKFASEYICASIIDWTTECLFGKSSLIDSAVGYNSSSLSLECCHQKQATMPRAISLFCYFELKFQISSIFSRSVVMGISFICFSVLWNAFETAQFTWMFAPFQNTLCPPKWQRIHRQRHNNEIIKSVLSNYKYSIRLKNNLDFVKT
jgi:hypothetical protein